MLKKSKVGNKALARLEEVCIQTEIYFSKEIDARNTVLSVECQGPRITHKVKCLLQLNNLAF